MKSCRVKALEYIQEDKNEDIKSFIQIYLSIGVMLLIIMAIILSIDDNYNLLLDHNIVGLILLTIIFLALTLIVYALVLKKRQNVFEESVLSKDKNALLNWMRNFNSFASEEKDFISYFDVSRNANGLNILLLPFMFSCCFYLIGNDFFIVSLFLVFASLVITVLTHCFPDKLSGIWGMDVRGVDGFRRLFVLGHLTFVFAFLMLCIIF